MVRDALYIFVHHLSATIVMFLQGLYDPSAREEMKEEMRISFDVCFQAAGHGKPVFDRVGEKGYRAISAMLKVRRSLVCSTCTTRPARPIYSFVLPNSKSTRDSSHSTAPSPLESILPRLHPCQPLP